MDSGIFSDGQLFINLCSSSSWQLWAALSSDANAGKPGCKGLQGYIHSHGGEYIYRGYKSEGTKDEGKLEKNHIYTSLVKIWFFDTKYILTN